MSIIQYMSSAACRLGIHKASRVWEPYQPVRHTCRRCGRDAPRRVLSGRFARATFCALVAVLIFSASARAATPHPVRASEVRVVTSKKSVAQPAPLSLAVVAARLSAAAGGKPVVISCDTPGVPSPIDGHTLEPGNEGQVWRVNPLDGDSPIANIIHVSTATCWAAQTTNRHREQYPTSYQEWNGQRIDASSGPALEVLAHETEHVALQSADEGVVECTAVSNAWPLVRQFGLPAWEAKMVLVGIQARHDAFLVGSPYRTVC